MSTRIMCWASWRRSMTPTGCRSAKVWFNGFDHLMDAQLETFGRQDGEKLTTALMDQECGNRAFGGHAIESVESRSRWETAGRSVSSPPIGGCLIGSAADLGGRVPGQGPDSGVDPRPPAPEGFQVFGPIDVAALAATLFKADTSKTNGILEKTFMA